MERPQEADPVSSGGWGSRIGCVGRIGSKKRPTSPHRERETGQNRYLNMTLGCVLSDPPIFKEHVQ